MGTYYSLGVVKNFTAESNEVLSYQEWINNLNQRFDTSLFNIQSNNGGMHIEGTLKKDVFEENISDFYEKLEKITHDDSIADYLDEYGVKIDDYYDDYTSIFFNTATNQEITVDITYISIFSEGKVSAEEFSIEPMLMNWLFRHSNFGNCLSGCIISGISG